MLGYTKFMKDFVTKNSVTNEYIEGLHYRTTITSQSLAQNKGNLRAFTISYTIGTSRFARALCELGTNINLMPLAVA